MSKMHRALSGIRAQLQKAANPYMFYDIDTDGITSYLQIKKVFPKLKGFPYSRDPVKARKALESIPKKTDLLLLFDIPDPKEEVFNLTLPIIWLDHHALSDKEYDKNITIVNPLQYDEHDNRPIAYWSYYIAQSKENLPLGTLGSVSDFFLTDLLLSCKKEQAKVYRFLLQGIEKTNAIEQLAYQETQNQVYANRQKAIYSLWYETPLGKLKRFIDAIVKLVTIEEMQEYVDKVLCNNDIQKLYDLLETSADDVMKEYNILQQEYEVILQEALQQTNKPLFMFEYGGETSFTKQLSEELCYRLEDWKAIVVCHKKEGRNMCVCSLRGNEYNVHDLLKESIKGLKAQGGGHPFACGVRIAKEHYAYFKTNMQENFKKEFQ